jgi:hypothetical protein
MRTNRSAFSGKDRSTGLSPRHAAFVNHYTVHFNGARAAREAGYAKKAAHVQASRLLRNVHIAAEIERRRAALAEQLHDISRDRIKREIACLALANMQDFSCMFGAGTPAEKLALLTREQAASVQELVVEESHDGRSGGREIRRIKFKLADKRGSLELLARIKGMLTEKHDRQLQHQGLIIQALLQDIDERTRGKPIVEVAVTSPALGT